MYAFTHSLDPIAKGAFMNQCILGLDAFGSVQNVDGLSLDELTAHMLTSTLFADSGNYHSCIVVDEYMSYTEDGATAHYEFVWVYMFRSLLYG